MYINAIGCYVPPTRIGNDYFLNINGLTDEWIVQRTGISTRSKASKEETINMMCIEAVKNTIPRLPYDIKEVDVVIFASYTPSDSVATTAHVIQREFGIENAKVFLISSACSSAINAMEIINSFFTSGIATKALLISADRNSTYSNESDPKAGHLWGDAAASIFFSKENYTGNEAKVVSVQSQGLGHIGKGPGGVFLQLKNGGLQMPDGKDVFTQACNYITQNAKEIVEKNGYAIDDLDYFIGHQANMRILNNVARQLNLPEEKVLSNISRLGNTGSVSSLLVFAENYDHFQPGDLVCISVFGGGYSSGASLIKI